MWGEVEAAGSINHLLLGHGEVREDGEAGQVHLERYAGLMTSSSSLSSSPSSSSPSSSSSSYQSYGLVLGSRGDGEDLRGGVKGEGGR